MFILAIWKINHLCSQLYFSHFATEEIVKCNKSITKKKYVTQLQDEERRRQQQLEEIRKREADERLKHEEERRNQEEERTKREAEEKVLYNFHSKWQSTSVENIFIRSSLGVLDFNLSIVKS